MTRIVRFTLSLALVGLLAGIAAAPASAAAPNANMPVFPFAKKAGFNTLTKALQVADLVGTINSTGPITVFAPTDAAFEKLERANPGILNQLLSDPQRLRRILLLHVVQGEVPSGTAVSLIGTTQQSINGLDLQFKSTTEGVGLQINNAVVIDVDKFAKNGVIHVMGDVILPN